MNRFMLKRLLISVLAVAPLCALAQFDTGDNLPPPKPAWQQFKLPKKSVKLDFRNANADMVLSFFSKASGITIVKDPTLTQPLTIQSANAVTLNDAFNILNTTLTLRNFELAKQGNLLVVQAKQQRGGGGMGRLSDMMGAMNQNKGVLRVYPIQFANASSVARVLNEVFANDTSANQNPFANIFGGGGGGRGRGGGANFQINGGGAAALGGGAQQGPVVHASADDFSNSVIVNAPDKQQSEITDLIKQIDKQADEPFQSKVYKLQYASSDDLAPVVQNVLTANAPKGKGGVGSTNVPFEQRFQQAARLGSFQASFGTVVSEPRTNSLIVSATPENHVLVQQVVTQLDTEIHFADSATVIPLDNAKADLIANLLNQAFQSRVANTSVGGTGTNRNNNNTNINNTNRNNGGGGGGGGGGLRLGGLNQGAQANNSVQAELDAQAKELQVQLADPSLNAGELQTNIGVQGGFFGGGQFGRGGGQQNGQNNSQITQGRDAQGRLTNIRNLSGQVTVIPDINTNSLIVVTAPENMALVRSILDQLDRIPQQVMIETIITEATLSSSDKLGVEWQFIQGRAFGTPGATGTVNQDFGLQAAKPSGFKYTLAAGALNVFLNALKTDSKFQILSTPRIFTSNGVQAQINISQSIPYVVSQQVDTNGNINYTYNFEDVGIILTVTPRITANGYVSMDVTQTANDLQGFTSFNAPIVNQRQATTSVAVKDGETIILGGIIRNTVTATTNKIPLLGDIPILGQIFRSTTKSKDKTELLVFLTPHVVTNDEDARRLRDQQIRELSKQNQKDIHDKINSGKIPPKEGGQ
jgi:general secretion pathway protein D